MVTPTRCVSSEKPRRRATVRGAARRDTAGPAGAEEITLELLDDTAGPVGVEEIALGLLDDTAGPVTESFAGVAADKTGADDPSDEEEEEDLFERSMRGMHPDIQRLIRRYGLLFLPYSQRTWMGCGSSLS